jgi:regulator of nucleoside diphosphate kinase
MELTMRSLEAAAGAMPTKPRIYIEAGHYDRLFDLATLFATRMPEASRLLLDELERAEILDGETSPDFVTIGSTVTFARNGGQPETMRLVYPDEADMAEKKVSVLTPIGAALLGLQKGQEIAWNGRDGLRSLAVLDVTRG